MWTVSVISSDPPCKDRKPDLQRSIGIISEFFVENHFKENHLKTILCGKSLKDNSLWNIT